MSRFQTRQCTDLSCRLRFPIAAGSTLGDRCPHCDAKTQTVDLTYSTDSAKDLRDRPPGPALEVLLDNIRSLRNVGAILRSADGVGVQHVHIGGFTPPPDHAKMAKTALGAELSLNWTRHRDSLQAATALRERGVELWALEGGARSIPLFSAPLPPPQNTLCLLLGHEVSGIDPRLLDLCTQVVRIPMLGIKGSLNVAVAFGIAAYAIRFDLRTRPCVP